jgi:transposase
MVGEQERQGKWVMVGSLRKLIPDDHILARVDRVLDLSWLRDEVGATYSRDQGRPSIPPETALRLMLAGFFQDIVHDRALLREAQVNLAIRWFAGYQLDDRLPDHSSLTRIRQRWGEARFKRIFQRTVAQCARAGLVSGETVHVDATLIRADVSWESLTTDYATRVLAANAETDEPPAGPSSKGRPKKRSKTDPDATLSTSRKDQRLEPSYKQHTAVDDQAGVIVAVTLTTGETSEGRQLPAVLQEVAANVGRAPTTVTADGGYAHPANYQQLEEQGIAAVIPPQPIGARPGRLPLERFKYDAQQQVVRCPGGARLPRSVRTANGWVHRAKAGDCRNCRWRAQCVPASAKARTVLIVDGYASLLRGRRRRRRWGALEHGLYNRHRWRVEGAHAEAKTRHGLRRAVRRGMANVAIQVYLTAAVMNLKRLAALSWLIFALLAPLRALRDARRRLAGETLALADQSALTKTLFARAAA